MNRLKEESFCYSYRLYLATYLFVYQKMRA